MTEEKKDVLVKVSFETRKKLKVEASKRDLSIKDFIEKMVDKVIEINK